MKVQQRKLEEEERLKDLKQMMSETVPRRNEKRQSWRWLSARDHQDSRIQNIFRSNLLVK